MVDDKAEHEAAGEACLKGADIDFQQENSPDDQCNSEEPGNQHAPDQHDPAFPRNCELAKSKKNQSV